MRLQSLANAARSMSYFLTFRKLNLPLNGAPRLRALMPSALLILALWLCWGMTGDHHQAQAKRLNLSLDYLRLISINIHLSLPPSFIVLSFFVIQNTFHRSVLGLYMGRGSLSLSPHFTFSSFAPFHACLDEFPLLSAPVAFNYTLIPNPNWYASLSRWAVHYFIPTIFRLLV